jgi:hypothetical protein
MERGKLVPFVVGIDVRAKAVLIEIVVGINRARINISTDAVAIDVIVLVIDTHVACIADEVTIRVRL